MIMRASQTAIAEVLNLSVATVSRSLRNHRAVAAETCARAAGAAGRLGYRIADNKPAAGRDRPPRASLPCSPAKKPRGGFVHLATIRCGRRKRIC